MGILILGIGIGGAATFGGRVSSSTASCAQAGPGHPAAGEARCRALDSHPVFPYHVSMDWEQCKVVERERGRLSGAWVFRGTRVPLASLFENLKDGASVDDYLAWFPGVTREQVEEVLACEARSASGTAA